MVISKVFRLLTNVRNTFILVNSPNKLVTQKNYFHLHKKPSAGATQTLGQRKMATSNGSDVNDPKRHYDFKQLLEKKDKKDVYVIDVREQSEIDESGKIPGSIHIPLGDLAKALGDMTAEEFKKLYNANKPSKDAEIIFSCKSGNRSRKALQTGLDLGYKKAANYKGGWLEWAEKNGLSK
ncbi:hypothetical protein RUM44_009266 [Polyplax serrata]|uniref:Rhodanese domain-containing protein n=1 Tax=Polyplax serrata TaxID=468196 RepID=A0ABR1AS71_POLSC